MRSSNLQRALDLTVGGFLIRLAAAFRRPRPLPTQAQRVAVLQPTAIGDTLISAGVLRAIRRRFPQARLTVLHGPSNAAAMPLIGESFEAEEIAFTRPWRVLAALRRLEPEVVIDLTPWPRTTALCAMASGAVSVGYDSVGQVRGAAFDVAVPHLDTRHEIDNARAMAAALDPAGTYTAAIDADLPDPPAALPYDKLILLHAMAGGSRRMAKAWPKENWGELARRLAAEGFVLGLTGTRTEAAEVEALRAEIGLGSDQVLDLAGAFTLPELAAVLQRSRCLVSVDTGAVHLASAVGAPVVGLYGPTRSQRWGPWGSGGVGVDSPHPDAGYCSLGFETHPRSGEIMRAVSVEAVHAAVQGLLSSRAPTRNSA